MFENRVLRKTIGLNWVEVTGQWRRLHTVELYALYSSTILRVSKYIRMKWAGLVEGVVDR
jgi:hypothetical protein